MNIVDELVRVGAFNSKNEARTMIKNKGVSVIPCVNEDYETPCFETEEDSQVFVTSDDEWKWWNWNTPGKIKHIGKLKFCNGIILSPDGTKIPAVKWDISIWSPGAARFIEQLQHGPKAGVRVGNYVITWDIEQFGKNPWLLNDDKLECTLKTGDTVKIGKKRTIIVGE